MAVDERKRKHFNTLDSIGDVKRNLARLSRELVRERKAIGGLATQDERETALVKVAQARALVASLKALADIMRDVDLEARLYAVEQRAQQQTQTDNAVQ